MILTGWIVLPAPCAGLQALVFGGSRSMGGVDAAAPAAAGSGSVSIGAARVLLPPVW